MFDYTCRYNQTYKIRYCYFICLIISAGIWGKGILIFIIPLYILFSVVEALIKITTSNR